MELLHALYILFFFVLGSCVGSFLNVVVWRLGSMEPIEGEGVFQGMYRSVMVLSRPPSHCPKCGQLLKWYDNLPVIGWIKLGGRCRFCKEPISIRYPIVEAITGLLFVFYYVMFFIEGFGPCQMRTMPGGIIRYLPADMAITDHWPIYLLDMMLIGALLAASLIDAELFIIPIDLPWFVVPFALAEHAIFGRPGWPGALDFSAAPSALAAGAGVGLILSFLLWWLRILPASFSQGEPLLEIDRAKLASRGEEPPAEQEYTPRQIRAEMRKEMLFLMPPMILGLAWVWMTWKLPAVAHFFAGILRHGWIVGLLGSVLGALVGGFVVWFTRIAGSYGFGREAMGMGDVHLMVAVGAVLGPGAAIIAFFIAPFFGLLWVFYMLLTRKGRELPYGPYLSLASAFVMVFYCPIADYLSGGVAGLSFMLSRLFGGG